MLNRQRAACAASAVVLLTTGIYFVSPVRAASEAQPAFKIVSEDARDAGAALSVRIQGRLSEADLKRLADEVRQRRPAGKPPISTLAVFLPGMEIVGPPWAEATFAPDARVVVNGLRRDEEDAYRAAASTDVRDVVGVWLTSPPAPPGVLTIYREPGRRLFAEWRLRNSHKTIDEVYESVGNRGRRYDIVGSGGGYYLALWSGGLQLGDRSSVIAVAERLHFEKRTEAPVAAAPSSEKPATAASAIAVEGTAPPAIGTSAKRTVGKDKAKPPAQTVLSDALATALRGY